MDELEYGCDESNNKDDNSIISERCWKESYKGDSRKWLIRDGFTKPNNKLVSTMKATFPYPFQEEIREFSVGKRRALIMQKLYDEAATEIINERDAPPPVEKYCTEYDGNYHMVPKKRENEEQIKKELFDKYPLYTSPGASFWNFKIDKYHRSHTHFPGLTVSADLKNPFKRYSGFTKPISEVLDDCNL